MSTCYHIYGTSSIMRAVRRFYITRINERASDSKVKKNN